MILTAIDASIRGQIEGRPALVLGSAPGASVPAEYDPSSWSLICVNASGRVGKELGLGLPDITVFAAGALRRNSISNIEMRTAISGLATKTLIIRLLNRERLTLLARRISLRWRLRQVDYDGNRLFFLTPAQWTPILSNVIGAQQETSEGSSHNVSTGIFCCALALHLGARRISVAGIDPHSAGHAYSTSDQQRQHVVADERAIKLLQKDGGVEFAYTRAAAGTRS